MLSVNLSICVRDETDYAVCEGIVCDSISQLTINAHIISYLETELLQEKLQEFLQAASDSDGDDVAKTQVWLFKLSLLHARAVLGDSDLNRVSPPGRHALEEAAGFPPGQQRSERKVFRRAPGHQQHSGGQPMR